VSCVISSPASTVIGDDEEEWYWEAISSPSATCTRTGEDCANRQFAGDALNSCFAIALGAEETL
jgi:hypothetical protein